MVDRHAAIWTSAKLPQSPNQRTECSDSRWVSRLNFSWIVDADISAQWGFHPGGWGKPPMDDFNRPLYGDVFGVLQGAEIAGQEQIDRSLWGEIEPIEGMFTIILVIFAS